MEDDSCFDKPISDVFKTHNTITATVTKPTVDSKVGIDFEKQEDGRIYISSTSGLFAETTANVGYEVISLNGKPVSGMTRDELKDIIRATYGDVSLEFVPKFNHLYAARRRPPPNCAKGGKWGVYKYFSLFDSVSEMDAYLVNGRLYDTSGKFLTSRLHRGNFVPFRSF